MPNVNNPNRNYGTYKIKSFELEYGKVIEDIEVEYATSGTPKYDDEGYLTNAIVYCSSYKGLVSILVEAYHSFISRSYLDKDNFFIIMVRDFGLPDSYSPSTSKLKQNFPEYSFLDIVNYKRQFLFEKFKIRKFLGIIGEELGGFQVFTWACEYPDDMDFILILNSDFKCSGYRYILTKGFEALIDSIEEYNAEKYSVSLSKAVVAIFTFLFSQSRSQEIFSKLSTDEIEIFLEEFVDERLTTDIYDFNLRNNAILNYDVEDKLENIKAKTLIIYCDNTILFHQPADFDVLKRSIKDLKILSFKSTKKDFYDEEDYSSIGSEIISFLNEYI